MTCFLTSSHNRPGEQGLNPANGFRDAILRVLPDPCGMVAISAAPDDYDGTDFFCNCVRQDFEISGVHLKEFHIVDRRTQDRAAEWIRAADLIILMGGHVPTQNRFFTDLQLRELLEGYSGVIVGISAGSMNSADVVYCQPEEAGESVDPGFQRFIRGLNLTKTMILPHHQRAYYNILDGKRLFQDITYPDSMGHCFYALPDGSYICIQDGREELRGEAWIIRDGARIRISEDGDVVVLHP